jgi:hypothetical protein
MLLRHPEQAVAPPRDFYARLSRAQDCAYTTRHVIAEQCRTDAKALSQLSVPDKKMLQKIIHANLHFQRATCTYYAPQQTEATRARPPSCTKELRVLSS